MKKYVTITWMMIFISISPISKAGGTVNFQTVKSVAFNTGGFYLYADSWQNPNGCENTDAIVLQSSDPNYDKAFALLLAAYMSGKRIRGYSDTCVTHDGKTYNMVRGVKYLTVE